jgi:hypothetical protein
VDYFPSVAGNAEPSQADFQRYENASWGLNTDPISNDADFQVLRNTGLHAQILTTDVPDSALPSALMAESNYEAGNDLAQTLDEEFHSGKGPYGAVRRCEKG